VIVLEEFGGHLPMYELERRKEAVAEANMNPDNPANLQEIDEALSALTTWMTSESALLQTPHSEEEGTADSNGTSNSSEEDGEDAVGKKRKSAALYIKMQTHKRTFYSNPYLLDFFHGCEQYQYSSQEQASTYSTDTKENVTETSATLTDVQGQELNNESEQSTLSSSSILVTAT